MSSTMFLPAILSPALPDRDGITDALYRYLVGFDNSQLALFESAFVQDGVADLNGKVMNGQDEIRAGLYELVSKLDSTHIPGNFRINITGSTATMSASVIAQHYRGGTGLEPGATRYLGGGLYYADLVKDDTDGLWKMKYLKIKAVWGEGDVGVFESNPGV